MVPISGKLKTNFFNLPGWHTRKRIIVFESDDWGSIRIPSRETYVYLLNSGYQIDNVSYGKDCLESNDDITCLLQVLADFKNQDGQYPVFTMNFIMANPDFKRIEQADFQEYFYEPFSETYKRYPCHDKSLQLIKQGLNDSLLKPQLHGREHLNFIRWLNFLKQGSKEILDLFGRSLYGVPNSVSNGGRRDFQRAFDYDDECESKYSCHIIEDAIKLFNKIWGFSSRSFIAPNFFWDTYIEKCLSENKIFYIQGQRAQFLSDLTGRYKARYHFTGQKNKFGQIYLIRNCYFEPCFDRNKDWINSCLAEIAQSFLLHKPAVISTHRVNYIGSISETNRDKSLYGLSALLSEIIRKWPDVIFLSTDQLGDMISMKN